MLTVKLMDRKHDSRKFGALAFEDLRSFYDANRQPKPMHEL